LHGDAANRYGALNGDHRPLPSALQSGISRAPLRRDGMTRYLALIGAALLAVSSSLGMVAAQTDGAPVNADGSYVVANDDGVPVASGAGDDISYGDINTGGGGGEVLGDPNAVYSPMVPENPGPDGGFLVMPGAGDGLIGGMPIQPVPAAADGTTTTTSNVATSEGNTAENVPVESLATEGSTAAPVDSGETASGFCTQYPTWYDSQVAYENLGATAADPALVQEVDPDSNGIACEAYME
jgi:hypothetical protein